MQLFNTFTRQLDELEPIHPPVVTIYGCGPTVYDYMHIGNLRTFVFNDLLVRTLQASGFQPKFIQNITDIDDKIIKRATEKNLTPPLLAAEYTQAFIDDLSALNILPADNYPKATEHIGKMIKYIEELLAKGYAYQEEDGSVYFDISKFADYGKLSQLDKRQLKTGTRILSDEYTKDSIQDFALWKSVQSSEYGYDSPWGKGRPGWHIECSVMSQEYLGPTLDIHTGGIDLVFPHHENEIAQAEAFTGQKFAKIFLHCEHLLVDGTKMSKSLHNFYTLKDLVERGFEPLAFRYLLLTTHYRDKINFTLESLQAAQNALNNLRLTIADLPKPNTDDITTNQFHQEFLTYAKNDLAIPRSLATLSQMLKSDLPLQTKSNLVAQMDQIFGLDLVNHIAKTIEIPSGVKQLLDRREEFRLAGDFTASDVVRERINAAGFEIEDTPNGPKLKPRR